jgi:hypothetical protein
MIFSKNKKVPTNEPTLNFKDSLLEKVNEYKYFGLIFNSNGKLNNASQNLAQKGSKAHFGQKFSLGTIYLLKTGLTFMIL